MPDIIVLLTDGANNRGITPLQAVPYAVARRVRIYTIGFGTTHPGPLECTPQQQGGFGPQRRLRPWRRLRRRRLRRRRVRRRRLRRTRGRLTAGGRPAAAPGGLPAHGRRELHGQDASELNKVFANLPKHVAVQKEHHEVTATFAVIGALLALAAIGASIRWAPYP